MTLKGIGEQVGVSKDQLSKVIKKHIKNVLDKEAGELLVHELERLQQLENSAMEQAFGFRIAMNGTEPIYEPLFDSDGRAVRDANGAQVVVPRQDLDAVNAGRAALLKIIDQRSKLLGLYTTKIQNLNAEGHGEDREIVWRVVESDGDGRMHPRFLADEPAQPLPAEGNDADLAASVGATSAESHVVGGVEVVTLDFPDPPEEKEPFVIRVPEPNNIKWHG